MDEGPPEPGTKLPAELVENAGYLLSRLGLRARRRFGEAIAGLGLRPPHFGLLAVLADRDALAQSELAEALGIDPGRLVGLLDELEQSGLVVRAPDAEDRRRHAVKLTRAGRDRVRVARRRAAAVEAGLLAGLAPAERDELRRLLLRLAVQRESGADGQ